MDLYTQISKRMLSLSCIIFSNHDQKVYLSSHPTHFFIYLVFFCSNHITSLLHLFYIIFLLFLSSLRLLVRTICNILTKCRKCHIYNIFIIYIYVYLYLYKRSRWISIRSFIGIVQDKLLHHLKSIFIIIFIYIYTYSLLS